MFYNKQNYEYPFVAFYSKLERQTHFMEHTKFQQLSVSKESHMCFPFSHFYCLEADEFS